MAYSDKVLDHYSNPKNVGTLDKSKSNVGTGLVGAPECGDVMRLQIEVNEGIITDAKFKTFGCGSAIASSCVSGTPTTTEPVGPGKATSLQFTVSLCLLTLTGAVKGMPLVSNT